MVYIDTIGFLADTESGNKKEQELRLWVSLNILRVLKRYYPDLKI